MRNIIAALLIGLYLLLSSRAELPPNTIRWTTQGEYNNFGYDVFRGLAAEGPFERINAHTIAGAGSTDLPQKYEFIDSRIAPGTIYWYYVESVSLEGERRRVTPVYASRPKSARLW